MPKLTSDGLTYRIIKGDHIRITGAIDTCTESLVIPESIADLPVTEIAAHAFAKCPFLHRIQIPECVSEIGVGAFAYITEDADQDKLFEYIDRWNLYDNLEGHPCARFESAGPIGSGCDYTFGWTRKIPSFAFAYCHHLSTVELPPTLIEIGAGAFTECSIQMIHLPDGLLDIGTNAFAGCMQLNSIYLPETLRSTGAFAFSRIPEIEWGGSTESWVNAAHNPMIQSLPHGIVSVKEGGILHIDRNAPRIPPEYNGLFRTAGPVGSGCDLEFEWRAVLPPEAFSGLSCVEKIILPAGMCSIGERAFFECTNLKSVVLPDSVCMIGIQAFTSCASLIHIGPDHSTNEIVALPEGVRELGYNTFYGCKSIIEMHIPESCTKIASNALRGTTSLKRLFCLSACASESFSHTTLNRLDFFYAPNSFPNEQANAEKLLSMYFECVREGLSFREDVSKAYMALEKSKVSEPVKQISLLDRLTSTKDIVLALREFAEKTSRGETFPPEVVDAAEQRIRTARMTQNFCRAMIESVDLALLVLSRRSVSDKFYYQLTARHGKGLPRV